VEGINITNAPSGTIRSALRYPDFRWLVSGLAISQIGDWLYNLALVVLVYDRTHSERPDGLLREVAQGAAALRAHPAALRLVGADTMCSVLYGAQTVLLLLVARRTGLGAQGYGYMFAAIGAGGLIGTVLAGRVSRLRSRPVLAGALALGGVPTLLLAVVRWPAVAIVLTGLTGMGALLVEILTETTLQRDLDEDVFGRAYGLAFPAAIAGIVIGSVIAPGLAALLGGSGALAAVGGAVLAYALLVLRGTGEATAATRYRS